MTLIEQQDNLFDDMLDAAKEEYLRNGYSEYADRDLVNDFLDNYLTDDIRAMLKSINHDVRHFKESFYDLILS